MDRARINTKTKPLLIYFAILIILCAGFVIGARMMGQQGLYLAGAYMLTPVIAALLTRLFFYKPHFRDANLRFDRFRDYMKFWLYSLGITAVSFVVFTLFSSIHWDFSGKVFLDLLAQQFAATGQDMLASLPPGFTPQMMLWLFVIGGLTVFNIFPGSSLVLARSSAIAVSCSHFCPEISPGSDYSLAAFSGICGINPSYSCFHHPRLFRSGKPLSITPPR